MKDRQIMSEVFRLLGKKNGCPASGSEPSSQMAETHEHRGETPAMRKCASPFLQGSGSLAMFFPKWPPTETEPIRVSLPSLHWEDRPQEFFILLRSLSNELAKQFDVIPKHEWAKDNLRPGQTLTLGSVGCMLELPDAILKLPFLSFEPFDFMLVRDCGFHWWECAFWSFGNCATRHRWAFSGSSFFLACAWVLQRFAKPPEFLAECLSFLVGHFVFGILRRKDLRWDFKPFWTPRLCPA